MTVEKIMHRDPVSVRDDDDVATVVRTLRDHELPGVPVVNGGGRCVGMVTEADLTITEDDTSFHLPYHLDVLGAVIWLESHKHFEERLRHAFASTAADMMSHDPITVAPDASIRDAAKLISQRRHNRLPVVQHGRLVGVVTRLDILEALAHEQG